MYIQWEIWNTLIFWKHFSENEKLSHTIYFTEISTTLENSPSVTHSGLIFILMFVLTKNLQIWWSRGKAANFIGHAMITWNEEEKLARNTIRYLNWSGTLNNCESFSDTFFANFFSQTTCWNKKSVENNFKFSMIWMVSIGSIAY